MDSDLTNHVVTATARLEWGRLCTARVCSCSSVVLLSFCNIKYNTTNKNRRAQTHGK